MPYFTRTVSAHKDFKGYVIFSRDSGWGKYKSRANIVLPRIHVQGVKVVVHTKITRSQDLGVLASGQCCKDVENGENVTSIKFGF